MLSVKQEINHSVSDSNSRADAANHQLLAPDEVGMDVHNVCAHVREHNEPVQGVSAAVLHCIDLQHVIIQLIMHQDRKSVV